MEKTKLTSQSISRNGSGLTPARPLSRFLWVCCVIAVIGITVLAFTPIFLTPGKTNPRLFGIPWSLWTSFLITLTVVILTWIGTRVHPSNQKEDKK